MSRWMMFFVLLMSSPAWSQESVTLTYQGQLTNAVGAPVTASHPVTFTVYSQVSGGVPLWTETHGSIDVVDGIFSAQLGTLVPLGIELSAEPLLFLGITIGDNDEMSPRIRIGGALKTQWAAVAAHAKDVRGEDIHPNSVSIGETVVIDAEGQWVGNATGLIGPQGPAGPAGVSPDLGLDTDLDGIVDWLELALGTNPLDEAETPGDANADGIPDVMVGADGAVGETGPQGIAGVAGPQGPSPAHQWNGTSIRFQNPDGTWGAYVDLVGAQGIQGVAGAIGPAGNTVNLRLDSDADGFADWIEVALSTNPDDVNERPADENVNGIADAFEANVSSGAPGMPVGNTLYANFTVTNLAELGAIQQYKTIEGVLTISTNDLTRIQLPNLEHVKALNVNSNAHVTQLDMPKLQVVTDSLSISANAALTSLILPTLTTVGGSLSISANGSLTDVRMAELVSVGTDMTLSANGSLVSLAGAFDMLSMVGGDFSLSANGRLESFGNGFSALSSVGGQFSVSANGALTDLGEGFPALITIASDFNLASNGTLTSLGASFTNLQTVEGNFAVSGHSNLETLGEGFPSLRAISGYFTVSTNASMHMLGGGFPLLETVEGYFRMNGNHALTSMASGFEALTTVGSYLSVFSHNALLDIRLPSLQSVGGHLTIGGGDRAFYENDVLQSISFPSLTTVVGGEDGACRRDTTQSPSGCNAQGTNSLQIYRNPQLPTCQRDYYDDVTNVARTNGGSYVAGGREDCQCVEVDGELTANCP